MVSCGVGVNFKPLLKIWVCEGVKLALDKFRALWWIISSSFCWPSLHLGHEVKNYLLRDYSHFLQHGSEHLVYLAQLWYVNFVGHYYWFCFRHNCEFLPFQIFLLVFVYTILFSEKLVTSFFLFTFEASADAGLVLVFLLLTLRR